MSTTPSSTASTTPRPDFMATLGLLPPYLAEDVEKAYLAKLKEIRPDLGGDRQAFYAVQNAYAQAKEYVKFRGNRRGWIAKQVDAYLAVQDVIEHLTQLGASVEVASLDWLRRSFGDFAQLTEAVVGVRLHDSPRGDEVIEYLVAQQERLLELRRLDLAGATISDAALQRLQVFRHLAELDVSRTSTTWQGLQIVTQLPELAIVRADGSQLNWLGRWRLRRALRHNRDSATSALTLHPTNVR